MSNRLFLEQSFYLKQHAHNPVDWYPWGAEALNNAVSQNKLIHLSIGYASCHWCHVMAKQCFENFAIAQILNQYFINIKVDRQERPDLDEIYQKALHTMGILGGWPLTVFLTPQQTPFFGGTYFPPDDQDGKIGFRHLLLNLVQYWQTNPKEIHASAQKVSQVIGKAYRPRPAAKSLDTDQALQAVYKLLSIFDVQKGGVKGAPKFPSVVCLDLFFELIHQIPELTNVLDSSLQAMLSGGLYDHLNGGFFRYCVDENWCIPHFEKMLYDNAVLIGLYMTGWHYTGNHAYYASAMQTLNFFLQYGCDERGIFFASQDADSEGQEGKYYLWSVEQFEEVLGLEDAALACSLYGVTQQGHFADGMNVLQRRSLVPPEQDDKQTLIQEKLREAQKKRIAPSFDKNLLISSNALMVQTFCKLRQKSYIQKAEVLFGHLWNPKEVNRFVSYAEGYLEDVAYLANAAFDLYQVTLKKDYLEKSLLLVHWLLEDFFEHDVLYLTSRKAEKLFTRPLSTFDHPVFSGLSASLWVLVRLSTLIEDAELEKPLDSLLKRYYIEAQKDPFAYAGFWKSYFFKVYSKKLLLSSKLDLADLIRLTKKPLPFLIWANASDIQQPLEAKIWGCICQQQVCKEIFYTKEEMFKRLAC